MVSTILGADGQPIKIEALQEPQTSQLSQLQREFQGHPARGLTPSRLSEVLLMAEQGDIVAQFELFEDMEERDGHIACEMGKRRRAVSMLEYDIVPPSNPSAAEKKAADELKELLTDVPDMEDTLYDLTDATGKGFACLEQEWHRVENKWLPKTITHRPQSWFQLHRGFRQDIYLRDNSGQGQPLLPFGWITHTHKTKSGYVERAGLFRALVWPYLFKNYAVADLAEFLEIYGIPLRVGKYAPGASDKEKTTLLRALANIGHNAAGIIPSGMDLEFHDAAKGDGDPFMAMIDWCERTESKIILGATLTTQADRGSNTNALGNVHNEVRKDLRDSDVKQVASSISRDLIYPIAHLNGLAPDGYRRAPRIKFDIAETEDVKTYSDALPGLIKLGMKVSRKWAQEKLGIPEPEGDEDILSEAASSDVVDKSSTLPDTKKIELKKLEADQKAKSLAKATAFLPKDIGAEEFDYVDALVKELSEKTGGITDAWLETISAIVQSSESYDELLGRMSELVTSLPLDELSSTLESAISASGLAGRYDVQAETQDDA